MKKTKSPPDTQKGVTTMPGIDIQLAIAKATPRPPISKVSHDETIGNIHYHAGVTIDRCPRCHRVVAPNSPYCWRCGQKLEWEEGK